MKDVDRALLKAVWVQAHHETVPSSRRWLAFSAMLRCSEVLGEENVCFRNVVVESGPLFGNRVGVRCSKNRKPPLVVVWIVIIPWCLSAGRSG